MDKAKVLIVEDDDDLRQGLMLRLRASGYGVFLAEDGVGAVSIAVRERPDVVLLDLGLPGGDGVTVLERYAKLPGVWSIPVIVLTGRDPGAALRDIEPYAVSAFLRKPVDNDELLAAIDVALAGPGAAGGRTGRGVPTQAGPPVPASPPVG